MMKKHFFLLLQHILPQQFLSACFGRIAESRSPLIKNFLISQFTKRYAVDLTEAKFKDSNDYDSFNSFFIRELEAGVRPLAQGDDIIASPVDGTITQFGKINDGELIQAKGFNFTLNALLGNDQDEVPHFLSGQFATLYLAPHNYHRVHMPLAGKLRKTVFIPGRLFSVNDLTANSVPNLYARNERLIAFFDTDAGPLAVILVGAMIVGSIQTAWMAHPIKGKQTLVTHYSQPIELAKGQELGHFKMGSTVVLLFSHTIQWEQALFSKQEIKTGQILGKDRSFAFKLKA